jgi:hypothetical protein
MIERTIAWLTRGNRRLVQMLPLAPRPDLTVDKNLERGRPRPQNRQRLERRHYVLAGQVEPLLQQLIKLVTHG